MLIFPDIRAFRTGHIMNKQIIEICGAPGVGKSTLVASCERELRNRGYSVRRLAKNPRPRSRVQKMVNLLRSKGRRKLFSVYSKIDKTCLKYFEYTAKYPEALRFSRQLLMCMMCLRVFGYRNCDFLFCDEAFIQNVTSTAHNRKFTDDELDWFSTFLNENIYKAHKITVIDCHLDMEENLRRIEKRGKKGDRFNVGSKEEKTELLKVKTHNINEIIKRINYDRLIFCDTGDLDHCVQTIMTEVGACCK